MNIVKDTARGFLSPASRRSLRGAAEGAYAISMLITLRIPSAKLRAELLRRVFRMKLHKTAHVYSQSEIRYAQNISVGPNTIIGSGCTLDGRRGIYIGESVNFSSEAAVWTLQHDPQSATFNAVGGPVQIKDRAWISTRAVILPNVTIGEGAVVAAGAVVTKSVEPWTVVGGVPARKIGNRSRADYDFDAHGTAAWFI